MLQDVKVPDIGNFDAVPVIEVLIKEGEQIEVDSSLITLETDKATMEVPSPVAGIVKKLYLKLNDKVSTNDLILQIETEAQVADTDDKTGTIPFEDMKQSQPVSTSPVIDKSQLPKPPLAEGAGEQQETAFSDLSASPGTRRLARILAVDLHQVTGTGQKGRITKTDLEQHLKALLSQEPGNKPSGGGGTLNLAPMPKVNHADFGAIEVQALSRIKKISGAYLQRNWVMAPHVTQFDEADITELEAFRKNAQATAKAQDIKLTPLVFIMKAVVMALKSFPHFNASLSEDGASLIVKKYFHIGVAVDTPNGLVVPVLRDVDQKGAFQLARELGELSQKARALELSAKEMQGGCFSISSLGGIGGTAFTPIINLPEVAILGVSRSQTKAVFQNGQFVPRLMLPLSLSYDHRVIDGAEAARFTSFLSQQLSDIRHLLL